MKYLDAPREPSRVPDVSRRRLLTAGGITFIAAFVTGCRSSTSFSVPATGVATSPRASAQAARVSEAARVQAVENLRKPVFVPEGGALDPVSFSLADTLFWTDILMEHGQFSQCSCPATNSLSRGRRLSGSRRLSPSISTVRVQRASIIELRTVESADRGPGEALHRLEEADE